jgi:hypothetical protein
VLVRRGKGDGTFGDVQPPADFDRDGIPDLAVSTNGGSSVRTLRGTGDGSFEPPVDPGIAGPSEWSGGRSRHGFMNRRREVATAR